MILATVLLLLSAIAIYLSCELFVNGVEWVGQRAGIAQTAVGTVLAAFGTALPESVVTLVAVAFGHSAAAKDIGVGAALGGPLVLSTVAYAVVGIVLLTVRKRERAATATAGPGSGVKDTRRVLAVPDSARLARDQSWFMVIFIFKVALGFFAFSYKRWLGFAFLAVYGLYVWQEMRREGGEVEGDALEPLKLRPGLKDPAIGWALGQTGVALVVIFAASQLFVYQLGILGPGLGIETSFVALLLSPLATELPETMNAIIWVRQGKQRLALANISGAMMIQATVPSAFGIFFTPWRLDATLVWAAVVTLLSVFGLHLLLKRNALTPPRLAAFGSLYAVFAVGVVVLRHHRGSP